MLAVLSFGSLLHFKAHAGEFDWALKLQQDYFLWPEITYLEASGQASKLDLVRSFDTQSPRPVLLYLHGGGWVGLSKDHVFLHFLPYLQMGFAVVNVEYRMAKTALAPAAVEDARCALRWVHTNAAEHGLDPTRIVASGHSAGGHLSLTTGMLPAAAGLDQRCPAADVNAAELRVAAIINWFGITDVADLVEGPNARTYAQMWLGGQRNWREIAERVSPVTHVREALPPILTIHGDADPVVPYAHATRLHAALDKAGLDNHQLHTVAGGNHGGFSLKENQAIIHTIEKFLRKQKILPQKKQWARSRKPE